MKRRRLAAGVVAVMALAGVLVGGGCSDGTLVREIGLRPGPAPTTTVDPRAPVAAATPFSVPPTTEAPTVEIKRGTGRSIRVGIAPPAPSPTLVADAVGSRVPIYSSPGQDAPDDWMDNPTWEGLPVLFLVHGRQGDWLNVQASMRPNGATVWVRASDVTTRTVTQRLLVELDARRLTLFDGPTVVLQASVAPGRDSTPTPTGDFFVDGIVRIADPWGPYGAYQVSVSGFSNVYQSFGGGVGQIAIHGTNNPALIGTPASNGCVRMSNDDITRVATTVPLGTPVRIV